MHVSRHRATTTGERSWLLAAAEKEEDIFTAPSRRKRLRLELPRRRLWPSPRYAAVRFSLSLEPRSPLGLLTECRAKSPKLTGLPANDDRRSMRRLGCRCFAIEASRWRGPFTRYRIKMFAVNFLWLLAVWKVARGIRAALSAAGSQEPPRPLVPLLRCLPHAGWQSVAGFEANGVGQTPSYSGGPGVYEFPVS